MQVKNLIAFVTFISAFVLLPSCNNKRHSIIEDIELPKNIPLNSIQKQQMVADQKKQMIVDLVSEISALTHLEGGIIGFDGHKSLQPDYSTQLSRLADTGCIVSLTKHFSPIVRITAFESLVKLKYPHLKSVFLNLINDKNLYRFQGGCVMEPIPINIACYSSISGILTEKEKQKYKSNLRKQYKDTGFEYLLNYE
jgi:hypothetical protein